MSTSIDGDRIAEALTRAQHYWRSNRAETAPAADRAMTVALTREAGLPGTSVAQEVAKRLGWQAYDHELLEIIAREHNLRVSLLDTVDERVRSKLVTFAESIGGTPEVTEYSYFKHLAETVLLLGAHGRCVIVGRGAAFLLPAASTLRVRLIGDLDARIALAAERRGLSRKEADRWVRETDAHRQRFVRSHFGADATDPLAYDLVLNAPEWGVERTAQLIVDAVRIREKR